jgi:YidC/Oxa1 family membrane protein insertase
MGVELLGRIFAPLTGLLGSGLEFLHSSGLDWWLSIAVITVLVRTLLFPLTVRQVKSMRAMQDLKPEMDRVRAKYRDNRQKQQEELMKLYQERKVNPLGGCFPLLIQMPVFLTMFYVIRDFGNTHEDFASGGILWFQDLTAADPLFLLPIISAVTMLAGSEITAKNLDPQQRWLMRILPVVFTVFLITFPAGLFMYWITSNIFTIAQNYLIYHHGPGKKDPADKVKPSADKVPAGVGSPTKVSGASEAPKSTASTVSATKSSGRKRRRKKK